MKVDPNDSTFPTDYISRSMPMECTPASGGLTVRAYFAGLAMQGLLSTNGNLSVSSVTWQELGLKAVNAADLLIAALNKPTS